METNLLCRYFLHGVCSKGSQCLYAHDLTAKQDNVCKFYQSGSCMYGKSCRYDHVKLPRKPTPHVDDINEPRSSTSALVTPEKADITDDSQVTREWYNAPVFVPGKRWQGGVVGDEEGSSSQSGLYSEITTLGDTINNVEPEEEGECGVEEDYGCVEEDYEYEESGFSYEGDTNKLLCPFAAIRDCPYGDQCSYLHGDLCDMCGCLCLHPTDEEQRKEHQDECLAHHEREMELAFAVQRSSGVACSICLDVVKEKADITERVFGLLENCNHPFCLACIRKWRVSSHMEKTVIRACPICRINSWFITPSDFWMEDEKEKGELIKSYKEHLNTKHCRNFDRGKGVCPFGSSCFYKHELEDGTIDDSKPTLRHMQDSEGETSVVTTARLSEFLAARDAI